MLSRNNNNCASQKLVHAAAASVDLLKKHREQGGHLLGVAHENGGGELGRVLEAVARGLDGGWVCGEGAGSVSCDCRDHGLRQRRSCCEWLIVLE